MKERASDQDSAPTGTPRHSVAEHAAWLAAQRSSNREEIRAAAEEEIARWSNQGEEERRAWSEMQGTQVALERSAAALRERFPRLPESERIASAVRAPRFWRWSLAIGVVSCTMVVAAAAWWMNEVGLDAPLTRADYATLPGQQLEVAMADGSLMTLNTGSSVTVKMTRRGRYVALHGGEVMFRVHPDADRPFVVESPALRAAALGTVFSVLELPRRKGVFVLDGRVKASLSGSTDHIVVEAGDAWLVESDGRGGFGVQLERGQAKKFLAWKEGGLIFDNTPLAEVVREIARYRKSSIAISDDSIAGIRLSGVFDTSDIEGLIAALPNVAPVTVVRGAGGMVRIDPRAGMGSSVSDRTTHPAIISR